MTSCYFLQSARLLRSLSLSVKARTLNKDEVPVVDAFTNYCVFITVAMSKLNNTRNLMN